MTSRKGSSFFRSGTKGQFISKADWRAIDSPKKRNVLFAFSSVRFLGESTARQSAFRFYLTFSRYCSFFTKQNMYVHKYSKRKCINVIFASLFLAK